MKQNLLVKAIALLTCFLLLSAAGLAQDCKAPKSTDYLDGNTIKALIKNDGTHFFNSENHTAAFEVPKNSGKHTLYSSAIWLGGYHQETLHLAAMRFGQNGNDYWAGPISTDVDACEYYDHLWKITKEEIDYHKAHYADAGYVMPWAIANYPAHGRAEFGESSHLAPYKNVAGNASYEPELGDYPLIRGDQAVFFIINDASDAHTETGGNPLGVEIIGMAYAYDNSILQNCIFLSYEVRNKSGQDYHDFYFGSFNDFDIGYSGDDYIGCDSSLNLSYGYNGTEIDGNGEAEAYGENPPAQGAMFLNQTMTSFVYYNNSGDLVNGEPRKNKPEDYYNYLTAKWLNGQHITYGGRGTDPEATPTNYMFSGDPVAGTGWTELTPNGPESEPNIPNDRRGVMNAGPFTFSAGKTITVDIALPWARDYSSKSNLSSLTLLKQYAEEIQEFYNENLDIQEGTITNGTLLIYPNPTDGQLRIENGEWRMENVEIFNVMGQRVMFFDSLPSREATINVSHLPSGMYFVRMAGQTVKFVKK